MQGWVDLDTAVRRSPCPRLHIAVAVAINTTVSGEIWTLILSHRSQTRRLLDHCDLQLPAGGLYIAYADDIILLSASLINLQKMLDICFDQGSKLDIQFNPSKSRLFKSGPGYNQLLPNLHIGNEPIFLGW